MEFKLALLFTVLSVNLGEAVIDRDTGQGKSVCITEELFQMLMKTDRKDSTSQGKLVCVTEDLLQMLMRMYKKDSHSQVADMNTPVAFLAYVKDHPTPLSNSAIIKFEDVETNVGNHYNPSTGVFTAPKDGVYVFSCMIMCAGGNDLHFQWTKNYVMMSRGYAGKGNQINSQSIVLKLKKGDHIYLQNNSKEANAIHGHRYSNFSGYLLN